jgi:hypothetical protein
MSKIEVDAIEPQSGTSLTLGASGDTITIPSGATLSSTDPLVFPAGTASLPAITTTGDTNTGIFFPAADTIAFTEGGAEAMRIDSSARVGIGVTSPNQRLQLPENTNVGFVGGTNNAKIGGIIFGTDSSFSRHGMIESFRGADAAGIDLRFKTMQGDVEGVTERMRITNDGTVLIGKTADSFSTAGVTLNSGGVSTFVRAEELMLLNRLTTDGNLIRFFQATTEEGSISVSGGTVAYNGFTGSHWSRFIDESKPDVLRGTVMESLDQMTDWYHAEFEVSTTEKDADGNDVVKTSTQKQPYALKANEQEGDVITYAWNTEKKDEEENDIIEQVQATIVKQVDVKHVMSKISDTVEAKNVYGVFSAWDNDDLINNDFYVASVGSYVVRIKAGQVVSKGDLLQSNGDGTAKVQADDIIRASTFAKVLSNTVIETYEDGSFIVPCSLMC